jgi:hypothetical protein
MSEFNSIDSNVIKVGDPITKDLLENIKENFDNHEIRISSLSAAGGNIPIFNGDVEFSNFNQSKPDIFYYTARQGFSINDFRIRLFTKGFSVGTLSFDLQKSNDPNDANFSSILTSDIVFNFGIEQDYSFKVAAINAGINDITAGQIIRVKVTSYPTGFVNKVLMSIGAQ